MRWQGGRRSEEVEDRRGGRQRIAGVGADGGLAVFRADGQTLWSRAQ